MGARPRYWLLGILLAVLTWVALRRLVDGDGELHIAQEIFVDVDDDEGLLIVVWVVEK